MRRWSSVEGQAMVGYGGVLLLIALLVTAVSASGIGTQIAHAMECQVRHIVGEAGPCRAAAPLQSRQGGSPASAASGSPVTLAVSRAQCGPPHVCPLPTDPVPRRTRPQGAGPHAPEYASTNGGNQPCPPGYDFHVDANNNYPYCMNQYYDPNPSAVDQTPPPPTCPPSQTCIGQNSEGGCQGASCPGLWWQQEAWSQCMANNDWDVTACPVRPVQPVIGPRDPNDPSGPQQLFPYGRQQEQDYDRAYQQALASIVARGGIPYPSLDEVQKAKDESLAQARANAQVNSQSAQGRYAKEASVEPGAEYRDGDPNPDDTEAP